MQMPAGGTFKGDIQMGFYAMGSQRYYSKVQTVPIRDEGNNDIAQSVITKSLKEFDIEPL